MDQKAIKTFKESLGIEALPISIEGNYGQLLETDTTCPGILDAACIGSKLRSLKGLKIVKFDTSAYYITVN